MELRHPRPPAIEPRQAAGGQLRALDGDNLLDALSVRLDGAKAGAREMALNLTFADSGEAFAVSVENAVLHHARDRTIAGATAVRLTRGALAGLVLGEITLEAALADGAVEITGQAAVFGDFLAMLDRFDFWFEIAAP